MGLALYLSRVRSSEVLGITLRHRIKVMDHSDSERGELLQHTRTQFHREIAVSMHAGPDANHPFSSQLLKEVLVRFEMGDQFLESGFQLRIC